MPPTAQLWKKTKTSDPILQGVIYCPRPMHMWSIKPIGESVGELLIGNDSHLVRGELDVWPNDTNFNRGHLLSNANAHGKYQANRSLCTQVIDRKHRDLDLWPSDRNFNRCHLLAKANAHRRENCTVSMKKIKVSCNISGTYTNRFVLVPDYICVNCSEV